MRISDCSSDVCSSDLGERWKWFVRLYDVGFYIPRDRTIAAAAADITIPKAFRIRITYGGKPPSEIPRRWKELLLPPLDPPQEHALRSEERRGGKECVGKCRSRGSPDHAKKQKR